MENYRIWDDYLATRTGRKSTFQQDKSSTLFDTVTIYAAFSRDLLQMERMHLRIADDGRTVLDEHAPVMNVGVAWRNLDGFRDFLVARLTAN
jgi:hypothetical protein